MKILLAILSVLVPISALGTEIDIQSIPDLPLNIIPSASANDDPMHGGGWKIALGGGLSHAPRYEGSANDRIRFMPLLEANYDHGKIFISPLRGIGYNASNDSDAQYGVRLSAGHSRKQSDDPHLNGMGDISYTPEGGVFFNRRFAPWYISSSLATGSHGTHAELGGGIGFILSPTIRLRFGANLDWGDSTYNQTYFGVTAAQAAASGNVLTAYHAGAGIKDYALTTNWIHNFSKEWFGNGGVSYKWLKGSAQQSPLTQRNTMTSLSYLVGYRF